MKKIALWFFWLLSKFLFFHVNADGGARRIGINWMIGVSSYALVPVIPLFPWLSIYQDRNTGDFCFGWRIYVVIFRIRRHNEGRWFFKMERGFFKAGKQSVLMTLEQHDDALSGVLSLNMSKYKKHELPTMISAKDYRKFIQSA